MSKMYLHCQSVGVYSCLCYMCYIPGGVYNIITVWGSPPSRMAGKHIHPSNGACLERELNPAIYTGAQVFKVVHSCCLFQNVIMCMLGQPA